MKDKKFQFKGKIGWRILANSPQFPEWRTRMQPIRTAAEITAHIKILPVQHLPLYQKLAQKATELRLLGMSYKQIARALNIGKNTAKKACKFGRR